MFLNKYLSDLYIELIYDTYEKEYIESLNENKFRLIYLLFVKYNFNFIDDIILRYLEIFRMDFDYVYNSLEVIKNTYGKDFVKIISKDMTILNYIVEKGDNQ